MSKVYWWNSLNIQTKKPMYVTIVGDNPCADLAPVQLSADRLLQPVEDWRIFYTSILYLREIKGDINGEPHEGYLALDAILEEGNVACDDALYEKYKNDPYTCLIIAHPSRTEPRLTVYYRKGWAMLEALGNTPLSQRQGVPIWRFSEKQVEVPF